MAMVSAKKKYCLYHKIPSRNQCMFEGTRSRSKGMVSSQMRLSATNKMQAQHHRQWPGRALRTRMMAALLPTQGAHQHLHLEVPWKTSQPPEWRAGSTRQMQNPGRSLLGWSKRETTDLLKTARGQTAWRTSRKQWSCAHCEPSKRCRATLRPNTRKFPTALLGPSDESAGHPGYRPWRQGCPGSSTQKADTAHLWQCACILVETIHPLKHKQPLKLFIQFIDQRIKNKSEYWSKGLRRDPFPYECNLGAVTS